jgi:class 3 adenylate cyclase/tetratricopeptide (TPR) repeat protein
VPEVGEFVRERYELKERLGGGAQGTVWRAFDQQHRRDVALKVRAAGKGADREALLTEARTLFELHPHAGLPLVREDFFDGEHYFLVMDWVAGQSLADILRAQGDPGIAPSVAVGYLVQLAAALDHLHSHRPPVVHGDIKPANAVVGPEGKLVLVDFGLVGLPSPAGTEGYVAPEVTQGTQATPAADIYGLAALAVTLLTGRPPDKGRPSWEGVDPIVVGALERGVRRGLAVNPERRPSSASALIERLSGALSGALPEGVVTFLLTDIEGSSGLWDAHPQAMGQVIAKVEAMVAEHVEEHGGRLIKSRGEGDSTLSAFTHATAAASSALDLHAELAGREWPDGIEVRLRVALHTGQAELREGDYYGTTLNRAARLRGLAGGGHILCSRVTAELLADDLQPGARLVELGEAALRGMDRAETVFALVPGGATPPSRFADISVGADVAHHGTSALQHMHAAVAQLPTEGLRGIPLVGRSEEFDRLLEAWSAASGGTRRAVFIAGEPGVGKTRLAFEAARAAHANGGVVLFGRCEEDLSVPYQPFVEAVGDFVAATDPVSLRRQCGRRVRELGRILPGLAEKLGDVPPPTDADAETERYLLLEAVVDLLAAVSAETPTVLIIDDLQWAARPTLLLLRHLLHAPANMPLLVVVTYRDTELLPDHALADILSDLRRVDGVERLELKGLDEDAVTGFLAAAGGHELNEEATRFARRLCSETGGNPFFLGEVLANLAESGLVEQDEQGQWQAVTGREGGEYFVLPESVREVIGTRLSRLSPAVGDALSVGAVIGQSFTLELLEAVPEAGQPIGILDALEEAVDANLIIEEAVGVFRFEHALVRQTLYERITSTKQLRMHQNVALALEGLPGVRQAARVVELAHHFGMAAPLGLAEKALEYTRRAGENARTFLAFDEAAAHFDRALALLDLVRNADPGLACELLIARGESLHRAADARWRDTLLQAAALARQDGNAEQLAAAALSFSHFQHPSGIGVVDTELVELLEDALERLDDGDSTLRSQVLALLAVELTFHPDSHRRELLAQEAVAMARRVNDRRSLPRVVARAMWVIAGVPEAFALGPPLAEELLSLGRELDDAESSFYGHLYLFNASLEIGELNAADQHLEAAVQLARELRQPAYLWNVELLLAVRAILKGDLTEAERLCMSAFEIGQSAFLPETLAVGSMGGQLFVLRHDQGRLDELELMARMAMEQQPGVPTWHMTLAVIYWETGRTEEAREHFELGSADHFTAIPRDFMWLTGMVLMAELATHLNDRERAEELTEILRPYTGRMGWAPVACAGPVDLRLGMLAGALGKKEEAIALLNASVELCERLETPTWLARSLLEKARLSEGAERQALASRAVALANDVGAAGIAARCKAVLDA